MLISFVEKFVQFYYLGEFLCKERKRITIRLFNDVTQLVNNVLTSYLSKEGNEKKSRYN